MKTYLKAQDISDVAFMLSKQNFHLACTSQGRQIFLQTNSASQITGGRETEITLSLQVSVRYSQT